MRDMFPEAPRRAKRAMMHVADAGQGCIQFWCGTCGYDTGWITDTRTVSENRRGIPCPRCNGEEAGDA